MSYTDPTPEDKETLVEFHQRLDEHFDRESKHNIVLDNIEFSFKHYLQPENHSETWSAPFPPISRTEFKDLSVAEREDTITEKARTDIQEYMENAALLSQLHSVELDDIEGLEQDPEIVRAKLKEMRTDNQTTVPEFA